MNQLVRGGFAALAAAVAVPADVSAQVEVVPTIGYYWPVGGWGPEEDDGTGFPLRRQLSAAILGARLSFRVAPRVSIEGTFGASPSQVAVSRVTGTTDYDGGVYLGSVRAVWKLGTLVDGPSFNQTHWDVLLGGGLGIVHRISGGWEDLSGLTTPALSLVASVRLGTFHFTFEDFISWAQYGSDTDPNQTEMRMHNDLVGAVGFTIPLGSRR